MTGLVNEEPSVAVQVAAGVTSGRIGQVASAMEPYLRLGDQQLSGAEWSVPVNRSLWSRHLTTFPTVSIAVDEHHRISRTALLGLADQARSKPSTDTRLNLFWNVLAWGIAGNFRNVGRIVRAVTADPNAIAQHLGTAADASYAGHPDAGFRILANRVPHWGPAFFTKYLHFTTDTTSPSKVQSLILDDRVRVAWRCLAGE